MNYYLAIDIGASSGRHMVGWCEEGKMRLQEVYRFPNGVDKVTLQRETTGSSQAESADTDKEHPTDTCQESPTDTCREHLVWDVERLFREVKEGIRRAFAQYEHIQSLSVDTWGVDYVLMEGDKEILPVFAYRDPRTQALISKIHEKVPFETLYDHTGCQFQPFNSLYQLCEDQARGRLERASDLLMLPEYLIYRLTGRRVREYTNATTTGLVSARTGQYDCELLQKLGLPERLFPPLQMPGTKVGSLRPELAAELGGQLEVVLCATHDTASAVEGIPMEGNHPYISSGTWSLLGVKTAGPITDEASRLANYSNEGGPGYNRYQKNIMGLWLVQELRKELCPDKDYAQIAQEAQESSFQGMIDANHPDFLAPRSMKEAFDKALPSRPTKEADYFRCAYRSLALSYQKALQELEHNTGCTYEKLYIVGGGAKNSYLNELTREFTGKEVVALPIEATALGNLNIQREVRYDELSRCQENL